MTQENAIIDFIKKNLSEYSYVDVGNIKDETELTELNIDSLKIIEFWMALEDEFDIEVSDEAAEAFIKVSDVINYVKENA